MTEHFVSDRLTFLKETAKFRRIDIHWCLTLEPAKSAAFSSKPKEQAGENTRLLTELQKAATILQSHLGHSIGLELLSKERPSSSSATCSTWKSGQSATTCAAIQA